MAKAWPGSQGGTYGGNAVACAAAIATLDVIRDEKLVDNARVVGAALAGGLEKVAADTPGIGDVRGLGLMLGSEFVTADGAARPGHGVAGPAEGGRARAAAADLRPVRQRRADDPGAGGHRGAGDEDALEVCGRTAVRARRRLT